MRVFVGCYTKKISEELVGKGDGIYSFDFDPNKGGLKQIDITQSLNPSYITISKNGKYLYAVEEMPIEESPKIKSYKINSVGSEESLTLINEEDLPGSYSCHLSLLNSQSHLIVAAYMSGNILVYPIAKNGSIFPMSQNIIHTGSGPNKLRQESAHMHMIHPIDENGFYAVDLGLDTAKLYNFYNAEDKFVSKSNFDLKIDSGAGARHMVIHPKGEYAFIFSELTAELFSFKKSNNGWELLECLKTLPENANTIPAGAAIRMHPNGKFLYVSNRGHNSISIFKFDMEMGKMILIDCVDSGGKTPRDFNIDPSGKWLLAANQDSDNIIVFKINFTDGSLFKHSENNDVKTGCCIQFLNDSIESE